MRSVTFLSGQIGQLVVPSKWLRRFGRGFAPARRSSGVLLGGSWSDGAIVGPGPTLMAWRPPDGACNYNVVFSGAR